MRGLVVTANWRQSLVQLVHFCLMPRASCHVGVIKHLRPDRVACFVADKKICRPHQMRIASFNELAQGVLLSDIYIYTTSCDPPQSHSYFNAFLQTCQRMSAARTNMSASVLINFRKKLLPSYFHLKVGQFVNNGQEGMRVGVLWINFI